MMYSRPRAASLRTFGLLLTLRLSLFMTAPIAAAQSADDPSAVNPNFETVESDTSIATIKQLQQQLEEQSHLLSDLRERLDESELAFGLISDVSDDSCTPGMRERVALVAELPVEASCDVAALGEKSRKLNYFVDYNRGWRIEPFDRQEHPFDLRANGWIQFRHHEFSRQSESWTDNAGVTRPIRNRNAFDIERARLTLSGHAIDPRLSYFVQLDGDTDGGDTVDFFDYWWAWQLTDQFQIQMGKRKVSASRQWLLGARLTRFIDRPMANDFFRPDRTVGIWGIGQFAKHGHYELMVGNGYRTANLPNSVTDTRFTFAATSYVDPNGDFGGQIVDFDGTTSPLWRLGHSLVYSPQAGNESGIPLDEADFLRLSDGTRLTQTGALAAGTTVSDFDLWFYGVDMSWKYRGWSATSEVFLRWIDDITADGVLPQTNLFQHGFYAEGGRFIIPKTLDLNLRYSQVAGDFGTASEIASGFNWYPLAKSTIKCSFDATYLDGSPLQNTTSDILVGDDGVLFRSQFQAEF
ncbi:Phosphate-selective porin O and P [Stieleria varia]|uniref:Phosphate-selective porin O and P n=2 Tax=Stieleria varia TaxID=2528005 RepID=A0A5C6B2V8_9BACT|nr:Phosphate-selective porin O and P [Stieleria varia]